MPRKAIIYGIGIVSILVILGGYASWMFANSNSPVNPDVSPSQNPNSSQNPGNPNSSGSDQLSPTNNGFETPQPNIDEVAQVRDAAMNYIQLNHPETASLVSSFSWIGGLQTGGAARESYSYRSSSWKVTIEFPPQPSPIYSVTAIYGASIVYWEGTYQDGIVAEIGYSASTDLTDLFSNQEKIRNATLEYIQISHPQTVPFLSSIDWAGQAEDTGVTGLTKYDYFSGGLTVTVQYNSSASNPSYTITVDNTGSVSFSWTGAYQNGTVKELSYSDNIPTPTPKTTQTPIPTSSSSTTPTQTPTVTRSPVPTVNPTPARSQTPAPTLTPEQIRNQAMNYIRAYHTAQTLQITQGLNWTGGSTDSNTYVYKSGGWNVTLIYSEISTPTYNITAIYVGNGNHPTITWIGMWQNGIKQTSYTFDQ